jgi:hypothetical protein
VIKYGSLLIDLPFHPDPLIALAIVMAPPMFYTAMLLTRQ